MTVLQDHSVIDDVMCGEPVTVPVARPTLDTRPPLWLVGDWQLVLPPSTPRRSPEAALFVASLCRWTGWSNRRIAEILGTSHTTIRQCEHGRPLVTARSGNLIERLRDAYELVERIHILAGERPETTARALETSLPGRQSAVDYLRNEQPTKAYLAALDVLKPRERGMLVGNQPSREGATAPLHD